MTSQSLPAAGHWAGRSRDWAGAGLLALWRFLQVTVQAVAVPIVLFFWALMCSLVLLRGPASDAGLVLMALVGVVLWPVALFWSSRTGAALSRRRAQAWFGVRIPENYRAVPAPTQDERGHWWTGHSYYRQRRTAEADLLVRVVAKDPETWRDIRWSAGNAMAAVTLAMPCLGLFAVGVLVVCSRVLLFTRYGGILSGEGLQEPTQLLVGVGAVGLSLWLAPRALRLYGEWMRRALDPLASGKLDKIRLVQRVEHLTTTRADAVGSQAAELRRIERDLHDGAQARLVAIGMTLGTIEHLMDSDPPAARELLAEAREASAKALQELRDLVRGIHPPVLAERGLGDAVRALALDSAQSTEVTVSLSGRPEATVETAAYFCVSELLANAAKHSAAQQVWVDILFRAGRLRITVTDDGRGGAAPERGSGLRGIERRLGTFDGVLSLSSPQGGPTTITMELPCELSSPRISTSSERD